MSLELYAPDFSTRYEITHAISIQLTEYYNDIGKMILVVPIDDYNIRAIQVGGILYRTETETSHIIQNVKYDADQSRITATGYTTNWLLNKRVIASLYAMTNIEAGAYAIVNENMRGFSNITVASSKGFSDTTSAILYGGQLLDSLIPIFSAANIGQRMTWNPDTLGHVFEVYKGRDLTSGIHAVVFSEEQGSAQSLVITDDNSTFKNVAYVTGKLDNDTEIVVVTGNASGDDRYEHWDGGSTRQEDGETETAFRARLAEIGAQKLAERIRRQTFSVIIDPSDYGYAFQLGDVVSCVSVRFSMQFNARISGVKYTMDSKSTGIELILGDPILTAIGEMKLNG